MVPRFERGVGIAGKCVGGAFCRVGVGLGVRQLVGPAGSDVASAIYSDGRYIEVRPRHASCAGAGTEAPVRKPEDPGLRRSTAVSMGLVLLLIFLFVPWQVAFLGCWIIQLLHCAAHLQDGRASSMANIPMEAIPLRLQTGDGDGDGDSCERIGNGELESSAIHDTCRSPTAHAQACRAATHAFHQNAHILLLLTWLLPLTAPVLAVWVRTLLTAGYTTPFNGDHNVVKVAPILWLVDYLGRGRTLDTRYSAFFF